MKPRHWSFIILLSLFAAFSARAQSLALEAVEYERTLYEGAAPAVANDAILNRTRCLVELGRWQDASASLERLRMYALDQAGREDASYLKTLCQYRQGNYEAAAAVMNETPFAGDGTRGRLRALVLASVRDYDGAMEAARPLAPDQAALEALFERTPKFKSARKAMFLGIIPTLGHIYVERPDLWWTTAGSLASAAFAVYEAVQGNWVTAILGGGLLVNGFYVEEHLRPLEQQVAEYNTSSLEKFLKELENVL